MWRYRPFLSAFTARERDVYHVYIFPRVQTLSQQWDLEIKIRSWKDLKDVDISILTGEVIKDYCWLCKSKYSKQNIKWFYNLKCKWMIYGLIEELTKQLGLAFKCVCENILNA